MCVCVYFSFCTLKLRELSTELPAYPGKRLFGLRDGIHAAPSAAGDHYMYIYTYVHVLVLFVIHSKYTS